jgi:hypothetical protein
MSESIATETENVAVAVATPAHPIDEHLIAFLTGLLEGASAEQVNELVQAIHQTLQEHNYQIVPISSLITANAGISATIEPGKQKRAPSAAQMAAQGALTDRSKTCAEMWKLADKAVWNAMAHQLEPVEGAKRASNGWNLFLQCKGRIEVVPPLGANGIRARVHKTK